jgi:VanZ family protein
VDRLVTYQRLRGLKLYLGLGWSLAAAITTLSLMPQPPQPPPGLTWDKLQHCLAYGALTGWFALFCGSRRSLLLHGLGFVALGALIEPLQGLLTATRTPDMYDAAANALGAMAGLGLGLSPARNALRAMEGFLNKERP